MRVVLDTNILVSAPLVQLGHPATIYRAWHHGYFTLLLCAEQLAELRATLRKPAVAARIKPYKAGRLVNDLQDLAEAVDSLPRVERSPDPTDDFLLAVSEAGKADYLVTVVSAPRFNSKLMQTVAGGWELSGIVTAQSGGFWTVTAGRDNSLTGVNLDRPNVVGDWRIGSPTPNRWFNQSAFQPNGPGMYGNSGRNVILGPKFVNFDMGLIRNISIHEAQHLQVRAEAFNVLNHTNLATTSGGFHLSYADPIFGSITSAADPRILQLALKYVF